MLLSLLGAGIIVRTPDEKGLYDGSTCNQVCAGCSRCYPCAQSVARLSERLLGTGLHDCWALRCTHWHSVNNSDVCHRQDAPRWQQHCGVLACATIVRKSLRECLCIAGRNLHCSRAVAERWPKGQQSRPQEGDQARLCRPRRHQQGVGGICWCGKRRRAINKELCASVAVGRGAVPSGRTLHQALAPSRDVCAEFVCKGARVGSAQYVPVSVVRTQKRKDFSDVQWGIKENVNVRQELVGGRPAGQLPFFAFLDSLNPVAVASNVATPM